MAEETDQAGQGRTDSHASKIAARGVRQLELVCVNLGVFFTLFTISVCDVIFIDSNSSNK